MRGILRGCEVSDSELGRADWMRDVYIEKAVGG